MASKLSSAAVVLQGHARPKLDERKGRGKVLSLLDRVELSHLDITFWHGVYFCKPLHCENMGNFNKSRFGNFLSFAKPACQ